VRSHVIGVAAVLFDDLGMVLLQQRTKEPGNGLLVLPGGSLDQPDPWAGISKELMEELGLTGDQFLSPEYFAVQPKVNDFPVIMLYFMGRTERHLVSNMEPEKCSGLVWVYPNSLPHNMWLTDQEAIVHSMSGLFPERFVK
jgi:8-oxo-dGTP pyrophosphatase MutT (NUDIX family)